MIDPIKEKEFLEDYETYNQHLIEKGEKKVTIAAYRKIHADMTFHQRLEFIAGQIKLADNFNLYLGRDKANDGGRYYFQIECYRKDVITGEMGWGRGGKGYLSPFQTKNEIVQLIFGLYKGYWEHEARESFEYRGRRVYGPHIDVDALWDVARRVDVRSAKHVEDQK